MGDFTKFLQEAGAALILCLALFGLALGFIVTYKAGIASRKRLEERAGAAEQIAEWEKSENAQAKLLYEQLKILGKE
jgi:hypothetical protein